MSAHGKPRILIVRVGAMGDVLHGMPAVAALRAALPDARLGWAIEPRWSPLLRAQSQPEVWRAHLPLVDAVHMVEAKAWSKRPFSFDTVRSVQALRHALRAERYDIAIDLQGSLRSAVIARLSGASRVVGSATPREWPARLLYTQRVSVRAAHVVDQAAEIVSAAVRTPLQPHAVALPYDPAAEQWCDATLGTDLRRIVLLAPTAGWGAKQWPVAKFAALALACSRAGLRVLVNKAGPDDNVADSVLQAADGLAESVDSTLSELIALTRRVSLVIAGDTGPLHLAAALGKPVVALFGPTDPARNGPFGGPHRVLRSASSLTDHRRHAATEAGLAGIATAEVLAAASDLLGMEIPHSSEAAHTLADNGRGMAARTLNWERIARRIRVPLGFLFAAVFLWRARPSLQSLLLSLLLVVPGLLLRGYAAGYVRKNAELTQTGPYAYTRNPLYLGSMLAAFGFAGASRRWELVVLLLVLFLVIYVPTIRSEERFLRAHFSDFEAYARRVPRLLPRLGAAPENAEAGMFSLERYRNHREYNSGMGAAALYAALLLLMALRARLGAP